VTALRALLAGIVDYAGLFPPAALDMTAAVRHYSQYRASDDAWMLGRFVVPVARLGELSAALANVDIATGEWHLSALVGANPADDIQRVEDFDAAHRGRAVVDSLEGKASDAAAIERIASLHRGDRAFFIELSIADDPSPLIAAIARGGLHAKVRTGGTTSDAFPSATAVARFMRACVAANVAFKATAGLHHPVRGSYRLTYAPDAPLDTMFGFMNVFLAAAAVARGVPESDAIALLEEIDPGAFTITPDAIAWREHRFGADELRAMRANVALSFGSCSFREPVDDLRALSLSATA